MTVATLPSASRACTFTVRLVSSVGPASVRYDVPLPGTSLYSYGVNRYAVETVWLQATSLFQPMFTTGDPISPAPATS